MPVVHVRRSLARAAVPADRGRASLLRRRTSITNRHCQMRVVAGCAEAIAYRKIRAPACMPFALAGEGTATRPGNDDDRRGDNRQSEEYATEPSFSKSTAALGNAQHFS